MSKLILNANHVFSNDPLRRAVYGITVENSSLRLWNFSRSGGLVSEPINWTSVCIYFQSSFLFLMSSDNQDSKYIIEIILRLSFTSRTALGYDETIFRYWINQKPIDKNLQYIIKVGKKFFRTVDVPLSDRRANFFAGRGTRVSAAIEIHFEFQEFTDEGPKFTYYDLGDCNGIPMYAVKVYWPRKHGRLEGDIVREIRQKAIEEGDNLVRWFPEIYEDGLVEVTNEKNEKVNDSTTEIVRATLESTDFFPGARSSRQGSTGGIESVINTESTTGISATDYANTDIKKFIEIRWVERYQYRIAFKGIGKTLAELKSLRDVFRALRDSSRGRYSEKYLVFNKFI